jgi:hypothetical protein
LRHEIALYRTLEALGIDYHALAREVESALANGGGGKLSESEMLKIYNAGYAEGHAIASRAVVVRNDRFHDAAEWRVMLEYCVRHAHLLGSRDRDFLESMQDWDDDPTEKQSRWLNDIYRRLRRRQRIF